MSGEGVTYCANNTRQGWYGCVYRWGQCLFCTQFPEKEERVAIQLAVDWVRNNVGADAPCLKYNGKCGPPFDWSAE